MELILKGKMRNKTIFMIAGVVLFLTNSVFAYDLDSSLKFLRGSAGGAISSASSLVGGGIGAIRGSLSNPIGVARGLYGRGLGVYNSALGFSSSAFNSSLVIARGVYGRGMGAYGTLTGIGGGVLNRGIGLGNGIYGQLGSLSGSISKLPGSAFHSGIGVARGIYSNGSSIYSSASDLSSKFLNNRISGLNNNSLNSLIKTSKINSFVTVASKITSMGAVSNLPRTVIDFGKIVSSTSKNLNIAAVKYESVIDNIYNTYDNYIGKPVVNTISTNSAKKPLVLPSMPLMVKNITPNKFPSSATVLK